MKQAILFLSLGLLASACSNIPPEAYANRGAPESLLDVSSEVVNLDVSSESSLNALAEWVNQDQPSRAELYCPEGAPSCESALDIMDLYGVPYQLVPSSEYTVALVYERVLARDCVNRYVDNSINPYHLNHPSFGCSVAVNMVQQVSDKQQFVRPNLLDLPDAKKAIQAHQNYMVKRDVTQKKGIGDSLLQSARTQQ